jgi:hypothetical protein
MMMLGLEDHGAADDINDDSLSADMKQLFPILLYCHSSLVFERPMQGKTWPTHLTEPLHDFWCASVSVY